METPDGRGTDILWSFPAEWPSAGIEPQVVIRAQFRPRGVLFGDAPLLEVFAGATPIEAPSTVRRNVSRVVESCPYDELEFDLSSLPDGEYLLVHRRSSAPEGYEPFYDPWETFEGEDALTTPFIRGTPSPDAGNQDAGP